MSSVMDYLERNYVEEWVLQGGVLASAVLAIISWCISRSTDTMLSTYIACLVPVLLVTIPDWSCLEWVDAICMEPVIAAQEIRRLAWERQDINMSMADRRYFHSGPFGDFMGSAIS